MSIPRTAVLLSAFALSGLLLTGCGGGTPVADPTPSTPSVSDSPSAGPTEVAVTPEPEPAVELRANVVDAVSSGNTAALDGYLAATVHVTYCASEYEGDVTDHVLIVNDISDATSPSATWDFDLADSVVDGYRDYSESYIDDFPAGAIVGLSSERKVLSFAVDGDQITRVFICNDVGALT
ncbi:hypothetical protein BH09ACT4_BH09ACT4_00940 [soil metagenome]